MTSLKIFLKNIPFGHITHRLGGAQLVRLIGYLPFNTHAWMTLSPESRGKVITHPIYADGTKYLFCKGLACVRKVLTLQMPIYPDAYSFGFQTPGSG